MWVGQDCRTTMVPAILHQSLSIPAPHCWVLTFLELIGQLACTRWWDGSHAGCVASEQSSQGGKRAMSTFSSSPIILRSSLAWTTSTDARLCPYIRQVNCSNCFSTWDLMLLSSPSCLNSLWSLGFVSNFFRAPTFFLFLWMHWCTSLCWTHRPPKEWCVVFSQGFCDIREVE